MMDQLHQKLIESSPAYRRWHEDNNYHLKHWAIFIAVVIVALVSLTNLINREIITVDLSQSRAATGATYYIDFQSGSDINDGLSPNTSWKHSPGDGNASGNPAAKVLQPGDTVIFKGGIAYLGTINLFGVNGQSGNPVTFKGTGWGTGRAIIDGEGTRPYAFFWNDYNGRGGNYIRLEGFEIKNTANAGIYFGGTPGGAGIEIVDNIIHDILGDWTQSRGYGIYYNAPGPRLLIENNEIYNTAYSGIVIVGAQDTTIRGNHIHDTQADGIAGGSRGTLTIENNLIHTLTNVNSHPDGMQILDCPGTLIIRSNTIYDTSQDIFVEPYSNPTGQAPCGDVYIYNNLIYNTQYDPTTGLGGWYNGIVIDHGYNNINSVHVYHNTLVDLNNGHGGFNNGDRYSQFGIHYYINTLKVKNNIFHNALIGVADSVVVSLEMDNNLYYNQWRNGNNFGCCTSLAQYQTTYPTREQHSLYGDAQFVNKAAYDMHLQSVSPAVDKGASLSAINNVNFAFDKDGISRPQGTTWDIGVYEFVSSGTAPSDHYINANCSNNGDGTNWSCAILSGGAGAFNRMPADNSCIYNGYTWTRGTTYWIAGSDNIYGGTCIRNQTGTGRITLKKASAGNHGTETGWQASYGSKQAVMGHTFILVSDVTIDGSYRLSPESGYGLKIQDVGSVDLIATMNNVPTSGGIFKYIELTHTFYDTSSAYAINLFGNGNNTIQYVYAHDISDVCFKGNKDPNYTTTSGLENSVIENSICGAPGRTTGTNHTELLKDDGAASGTIIRDNLFYDWKSTGGIVLSSGQSNWKIYNNIFTQRTSGLTCGNGVITGLSAGSGWTGNVVYNNTFANISSSCTNVFASGFGDFSGAGNEVKNNLFYNITNLNNVCGGGCVKSNNWYSSTPNYSPASSEISGTGNPFVNSLAEDFHLVGGSTPIDQGLALGSLYNIDKDGISRPQGSSWDIGAYEYGSGGTTPPLPPPPEPTSDTTPPTVSITSPLNGSTIPVKATLNISASATDDVAVAKVDFFINGTLKCSDSTSPYTCLWKVPGKVGRTYRLQASATDSSGNIGTSSIITVTAK